MLPHTSTNVQVRTIVKSFAQEPGVITAVGLTVIFPSQLSIAVKSTGAGISAAHCTIRSAGAIGTTGAVSSFTVIV